jgi:hypothetical protein
MMSPTAAEAVVSQTLAKFGRIDALVNIAGAVPGIDLFQMTDQQHGAQASRRAPADTPGRGVGLGMEVFCRLVGAVRSLCGVLNAKPERRGDARTISRIGLRAVGDMALLDLETRVAHRARGVLEQQPLLPGAHLPEQDAKAARNDRRSTADPNTSHRPRWAAAARPALRPGPSTNPCCSASSSSYRRDCRRRASCRPGDSSNTDISAR